MPHKIIDGQKITEHDLIAYIGKRSELPDAVRKSISEQIAVQGSEIRVWYDTLVRKAKAGPADIGVPRDVEE